VQVLRDGEEKTLVVTLGERRVGAPPLEGLGRPTAHLGVQMLPLTPDLKARLSVPVDQGVAVMEVFPETPASRAGLRRGDVVTRADGKEVSDPKDLRDIITHTGPGKGLKLTVQRGKETLEMTALLREAPLDGLNMPFPIRPPGFVRDLPSLPKALEMISDLEKKVRDLENRIKRLEEKSGKVPE
jgi:membrane-associated protease RseP (regulator of RpoE activity)